MTGPGDPQTALYHFWAAEVKPIITETLDGARDRAEKWAGVYDSGVVKGQLRLQLMGDGLFKLGFQGKQNVGAEHRNAWDAEQAVAVLNDQLDGMIVGFKETRDWLVVDYDPRHEVPPHPQYLQVTLAIEAMIRDIQTTHGAVHDKDVPRADSLTHECDDYKVTVDVRVMRFGGTTDYMVEVTPRSANAKHWNVYGLIDALEFHFGDDRVAVQTSEGLVAVTIYAEPQLG